MLPERERMEMGGRALPPVRERGGGGERDSSMADLKERDEKALTSVKLG